MNSIAFISDIHGNITALDAVFEDLDRRGITEIYCLGDLVGYYCFFNEVIDAISKRNIPCLMGNHDFAIVHNNGVIERSKTCTRILSWQLPLLTSHSISFLKALEERKEIPVFGKQSLCVHAGLVDPIDEYVFDVNSEYLRNNHFVGDILISGHTHLPSYKKFFDGKAWLNPGSVGQPRDGDNRASYLVIKENFDVEFVRIPYDYRIIVNEMRKNGFDDYITDPLIAGKKIGL